MASPPDRVRSAPRRPVRRALLALIFVGVGVWLIVTAMHDRTETVTARVSASYLALSRAENVHFKFADGSEDDEVSPTANGFFDAVAKFGPEPARVTRNAANDSIYKVQFHGKTYTLNSPGGDLGGGIIAVVLGLLGLGWVVLTSRGRRGPVATGELSEPSPARPDAP